MVLVTMIYCLSVFSYFTLSEVVLYLLDWSIFFDILPENLISETNMIKGITQSLDLFNSGEYQIVKCLLRTMLLFFVSS